MIRSCRETAFWGKLLQGCFSFQCFRLSWPTGMWSRHTFNADVLMLLTGTGECKGWNVRRMRPAVLPSSQFHGKAAEHSKHLFFTSLQAPIFHCSDAFPVRLYQFLKAIYPAFLMELGDRLKQKFLHVLPSPECTQTQRCMAWFMGWKWEEVWKLLEASLLSFAPCRPFHALLNFLLFQLFYKVMQQWDAASPWWWVDTLRTKDFVSHKSHPNMNSE